MKVITIVKAVGTILTIVLTLLEKGVVSEVTKAEVKAQKDEI